MTNVNGKNAADAVAKQAARSGKGPGATENLLAEAAGQGHPRVANKPVSALTALKSHGWKPTKADQATGSLMFTHPKLGNTFQLGADGMLTNLDSGTKIKPR